MTDKQKALADKNKSKREEIQKKKQLAKSRKEQKRQQELNSMLNIKTETPNAIKTRKKFESSSKPTTHMSKENQKWKKKREKTYNETVWKGWKL